MIERIIADAARGDATTDCPPLLENVNGEAGAPKRSRTRQSR
jgi:hypothetical protein